MSAEQNIQKQAENNPANLPPAGVQYSDPFGLVALFARSSEIVAQARLSKDVADSLTSVLKPDVFTVGNKEKHLDAGILARVMAQSPVIVELLDRRNNASVLLGADTIKREDFYITGAVYFFAEAVMRDPLLASDLVLFHAGEKSVNLRDLHDKLVGLYRNIASDRHSVVKTLLHGEFENTNTTAASAITAGLMAPLFVVAAAAAPQQRRGLLDRVKQTVNKVTFEVPKEVADLVILGSLTKEDVDVMRELSQMQVRREARATVDTTQPVFSQMVMPQTHVAPAQAPQTSQLSPTPPVHIQAPYSPPTPAPILPPAYQPSVQPYSPQPSVAPLQFAGPVGEAIPGALKVVSPNSIEAVSKRLQLELDAEKAKQTPPPAAAPAPTVTPTPVVPPTQKQPLPLQLGTPAVTQPVAPATPLAPLQAQPVQPSPEPAKPAPLTGLDQFKKAHPASGGQQGGQGLNLSDLDEFKKK